MTRIQQLEEQLRQRIEAHHACQDSLRGALKLIAWHEKREKEREQAKPAQRPMEFIIVTGYCGSDKIVKVIEHDEFKQACKDAEENGISIGEWLTGDPEMTELGRIQVLGDTEHLETCFTMETWQ